MKTVWTPICSLCAFLCALELAAAPGTPEITATAYDATNHMMAVTYTLPGEEDAIVTLSATYGGKTLYPRTAIGAINRKLAPGAGYVVHWNVKDDCSGLGGDADDLSVKLTAWSLATPPDYMAVMMGNPATVRYYASSNAVPGGVGDARWKENWLLMRKCPAKNVTWRMGCAANDYCWNVNEQTAANGFQALKYVTTTSDFYIGVYEFTQGQYRMLLNSVPSSCNATAFDSLAATSHRAVHWSDWKWHPVETITWANATNALKTIATASGLEFGLPTPAEWEFAARGETQWGTYNGAPHTPACIAPIGFNYQSAKTYYGGETGVGYTGYTCPAPVGLKRPNKYGLYDMVGNICEWCADRSDETAGYHPAKGGYMHMSGERMGVGYCAALKDTTCDYELGFRAYCRIPETGMVK